MGYKLTRESSIPDRVRSRPIANPELLETMREFNESDMNLASIEAGENWKKTLTQANSYSNRYFNNNIKVAVRGSKIYLKKI